jgi:hypothetical protein
VPSATPTSSDERLSRRGKSYITEHHADDVAQLVKYMRLAQQLLIVFAVFVAVNLGLFVRFMVVTHACKASGGGFAACDIK